MIHVVTKVGSAHRVPASDSNVGAEGAGGSTQVLVGQGSRRPLTVTLRRSHRAGGDHLGERWAWPWSAFADTSINTLNEILVFDLSLATGLYTLTNYAGTVMGTRRRGIGQSLLDVSD